MTRLNVVSVIIAIAMSLTANIKGLCESRTEALLMAGVDYLSAEIKDMYSDVRPYFLAASGFDPDLYIAMADIDFDSIPEFFYG